MGADAQPRTLEARLLARGYSAQNPLKLDLFKLCHHGSKANLSPGLLALLDCTRFAISTDGSRHNHPDRDAIARILVADPGRQKRFYFNFRQPNAELWDDPALKARWSYDCALPDPGTEGITIAI